MHSTAMQFYNGLAVLLIVFYFHTRNTTCKTLTGSLPVITAEGDDWEYLNSENTTLIKGKTKKNSTGELFVKCIAPYPVKWQQQGDTSLLKGMQTWNPTTTITSEGTIIYLLPAYVDIRSPAILKVTCTHYNNSSMASSLNIIDDDDPDLLFPGNKTLFGKQNVIPCLTTNLNIPVKLFKETSGTFQAYENATFEPTLGFTLNEPQVGNFKCRGSSREQNVFIQDYNESTPIERHAVWLADEIVSIKCNSDGEIETNIMTAFENETVLEETPKSIILSNSLRTGSLDCRNSEGILWNILQYVVVEAPKLKIDNELGAMQCVSNTRGKSISAVRCTPSSECELLKKCFNDEEFCDNKKSIYLPGSSGDFVCHDYDVAAYNCTTMSNTFYNGLIECAFVNKRRNKVFEFFTGLRLLKYSSWRDAPTDHLVRMNDMPPLLYANESTTVYCEAVKFLFALPFYYNITFSDGSEILLVEGVDYNTIDEKLLRPYKVADVNIVSGINIRLPVVSVRLTCYLFLITEPISVAASRNFKVKYLSAPIIERRETKVELTRGTKGHLTCKSSGDPIPEIKWTTMRNISSNASNYYTKNTDDGDAILEFKTVIDFSDEGQYICTSVNRVGNDTITISVTVLEHRETILFAIIFGTIAAMLLFAFIAFYFWRQKTVATNWMRQLTDEEIDDFVNGNRDMWLLNIKNQQENINYMPYNNEYEISINTIDFAQSNFLGRGAFGLVMTANLDDSTVAVKTTQPAADVIYCKSLLEELKIMIFVGHHENIVKLIGANTENIRNRKIYVLLELCTLGSLQGYLRESAHCEIREIGCCENYKRFIPTDLLLRWCYHIASAMEYLAVKNIVHADLATRNVLLNENQIAKIADFGLSVQLYKDKTYAKKQKVASKTMLPYRWMSIESLKHLKFSTETDVWSYGVTIWEIFSFGEVPYAQESWSNDFVKRLEEGMRLHKPKCCPEDVYNFAMACCWDARPSQRPSFSVLGNFFMKEINNENYTVLTDIETTLKCKL